MEFFSADEQAAFKQRQLNRRPANAAERTVPLTPAPVSIEQYLWRAACRDFAPRQVAFHSMCRLLSLLRKASVGGRDRFLFPSAGDTYSVQTYGGAPRRR